LDENGVMVAGVSFFTYQIPKSQGCGSARIGDIQGNNE
jgi:hypothetical protein